MNRKSLNISRTPVVPGRNMNRRIVLQGLGGATLALPFLETFASRRVGAQTAPVDPFAIFLRQANGVACAQETLEVGSEPERFWPRDFGELTAQSVEGRALDELTAHLPRILAVNNVHIVPYPYGDGHANGALQGLTARGPVEEELGGDSEADGESIDNRIARELNPDGRDSMFLYAGENSGWLGGACISYRGSANRRAALNDPWDAYQSMIGGTSGLEDEAIDRLVARNQSVNDLVRGQLQSFLRRSDLSTRDRERLDLHLSSVRDLETKLSCYLSQDEEMALDGLAGIHSSTDGDEVLLSAQAHLDVAALAVACGYTRSVALQVGNGNDGLTRYRSLDDGSAMENYHYVSHRRLSHGVDGDVIQDSDLLHSMVDRQFARLFAHLLDRLSAYDFGGGETLLDQGVAVWYNDLGNGPAHGPNACPYILAGSCGGYFKQGQHIDLTEGDPGYSVWDQPRTHARVLNTIATAVGCRSEGRDVCDDIGDPELDQSPLDVLRA